MLSVLPRSVSVHCLRPSTTVSRVCACLSAPVRPHTLYRRAMSTSSPSSTVSVDVVTYNLLVPNYGFLPGLPKEDTDPETRYQAVLAKIEAQISAGRPVVALQEVSLKWRGRLCTWFEARNYTLMVTNYGGGSGDYMGVGVAFPRDQFALKDCNVVRVGDTKRWKKKERKPAPGALASIGNWVWGAGAYLVDVVVTVTGLKLLYRAVSPPPARPPKDLWPHVRARYNRMISVALAPAANPNTKFWLSTYHMPCAFRDPDFMVVHAALAAQRAQKLAGTDPLVLLGDFNLKPQDAGYRTITDGDLPTTDKHYPKKEWDDDSWTPALTRPMASAYKTVNGREPEFTNYAPSWEGGSFCDTLDYIFCDNCTPVKVLPLPAKADSAPAPNPKEPSDHLLLRATIEFPAVVDA